VWQRFSGLFPKVEKLRDNPRGKHNGEWYISGIGISDEATMKQKPLIYKDAEAAEANSSTLVYVLTMINRLPAEERKSLTFKLMSDSKEANFASSASSALPEGDSASTTNFQNAKIENPSINPSSAGIGNIGSATNFSATNTTKNFDTTEIPTFDIGDRLAHVNPTRPPYQWHGRIVEFKHGGAFVLWDEKKEEPMWYALKELRSIMDH